MNPALKRSLGSRWPENRKDFDRRFFLSGRSDPAPPIWTTREARDAIMARI